MSNEDHSQLLNKISKLAGKGFRSLLTQVVDNTRSGQINRHKNGQIANDQMHTAVRSYGGHSHSSTSWYNPRVGQIRGGGVAKSGQVYRNRSLVLSNASASSVLNSNCRSEANLSSQTITPDNSVSEWVSKTDRHRQLINATVFEKTAQNRAKAIEETRKHKMKQRHIREKYLLINHLNQQGKRYNYGGSTPHIHNETGKYEVNVQGIRFLVSRNGSKLTKVSGEIFNWNSPKGERIKNTFSYLRTSDQTNSAKSAPRVASIGPVKFYRSRNGNMYRAGLIKAHRYFCLISPDIMETYVLGCTNHFGFREMATVKKVDEPCNIFSTTGSCHKGPQCRYIHNPSKVAVCKEYLQKGSCLNGDSCDLSHELTPERTPSCVHFGRGNCSKPNCPYTHVRVSSSALVCRRFATYGYCEKGTACMERHVVECPDFSNTGKCTRRGCKLPHREKASLMRNKALDSNSTNLKEGSSDISSDDEEIGSDDVDSDELDEFFDDEASDTDIPLQQDFVQLS
ncbi:Zinc finger CCCH domain-containing protein 3 [Golovinomyces cichoracearum]|uniref:Zinc finger CCCH domain-containing protein 3 n=1 Tax=Golovinomyces cichoracearum TaxID=62708 RepID=A0A420HDA0_9PEZI|nr:Zinc finger CCCH domain-containing protein 3 [Golovinomyces cichoracearum]